MYRFVKDSQGTGVNKRLFVQATLENETDNNYHQGPGYSQTLPSTSKPLKSSLKKTGPPITTSLNLASLPRSLRDSLTKNSTVYDGNYPGYVSPPYKSGNGHSDDSFGGRVVRDGNQTHFEFDETKAMASSNPYKPSYEDDSLQSIYTKKRLSTEVLGSSLESTKVSKKNENGTRRITTRIVRKVTTLSRGEEQSVPQELTRRAEGKLITQRAEYARNAEMKAIQPKKVKVIFKY